MHRGQHGFTRVIDLAIAVDSEAKAIISVSKNHSVRAGNGDVAASDRKFCTGRHCPDADVAASLDRHKGIERVTVCIIIERKSSCGAAAPVRYEVCFATAGAAVPAEHQTSGVAEHRIHIYSASLCANSRS